MTAAASLPTPRQLQLRLGLVFALAVSVGNIIGSGIMRTLGLVAALAAVCIIGAAFAFAAKVGR